jgi:ADP-heptose:LPS heptosyltransferase
MSLPTVLGITLENLPPQIQYLSARTDLTKNWQTQLGLKNKLRVGFCWSGRPDSWINRHKGMPFETMCELIKRNPNYEWINLQIECTADESAILHELGVKMYPGAIRSFADTAALIHHLDVVLSVDTAIAHLAGALGRPTWVMLNNYAVDWRWLLDRDSSPWYPSARLFRQPKMGDWASVVDKIHQYLSWFKI